MFQNAGPVFGKGLGLGVHQRHSAGDADQLGSVLAGGKVDEGLGSLRQLGGIVGDEVEGTLDLVRAIQNGLLTALHAAHGQGLDGVAHSRQGSVADGQRVGGHSRDDSAGGGQLLVVLALVLDAHDALEAVTGAGTSLTADDHDLAVFAAHIGPVGDLLGEDLGQLIHGQVGDGVLAVDHHGDAVQGNGGGGDAGLVIVQGAGSQADVQGLLHSAGDAGARTGGIVADGDVGGDLGEALGQGLHDAVHGGGTAGGDGAGQAAQVGAGSGRSGGSCRRSSGSCGGAGRRAAAAGSQDTGCSSHAADSQKRT